MNSPRNPYFSTVSFLASIGVFGDFLKIKIYGVRSIAFIPVLMMIMALTFPISIKLTNKMFSKRD